MISNQYPTIVYGLVNGTIVPLGSLVINAENQLILTPNSSSGEVVTQVWDPTANAYRSLTAPGGVLTLGSPGT
jgi:hypothetical protein